MTNKEINMSYDVSVITPVFNSKDTLDQAINSVQNQVGVKFQHILIDDCSKDNVNSIFEKVKNNSDIIILKLKKNVGPLEARNIGIRHALGEFIAFLDSDDIWPKDKLRLQINYMREKNLNFTYTDFYPFFQNRKFAEKVSCPAEIKFPSHYLTRYIICSAVMIKNNRDFFPKTKKDYYAEDFLFWSNLIKKYGSAQKVPNTFTYYRLSSFSRSSNYFRNGFLILSLYRDEEHLGFLKSYIYFFGYVFFSLYKKFYLIKKAAKKTN